MSTLAVIALVEDGHIANWHHAEKVHEHHKKKHASKGDGTPPLALDNFLMCKKCNAPWPCSAVDDARRRPQGEVLVVQR